MGWKSRGRMRAIPLKTHLHPERFWDSSEERERQPSQRYVEEMPLIFLPSLFSPFHHALHFLLWQIHHQPLTSDDSHSSHTFSHTHTDMHTAFTVYPDSDPEIWASRRHKLYRSSSSPVQTHPQLFQFRVKTKHGRSCKHTADVQTGAQDHMMPQRRAAEGVTKLIGIAIDDILLPQLMSLWITIVWIVKKSGSSILGWSNPISCTA